MNSQDLITKYLLDKKSRIKLAILQFLSDNPFYITRDYLTEEFQLSTLNFTLYMKELEADILSLQLSEQPVLKKGNFVKINVPYADLGTYYYRLLLAYCEQSTNYQILVSLLKKDTNSILSISEKTNFSVSYIYSRMKNINAFLFHYGIAITFSKPGKKTIKGNELQLHYCLVDIYWNIHSNVTIHSSDESYQHAVHTLNLYVKKDVLQHLENGMMDKLYLLIHLCLKNFPITSLAKFHGQLQQIPNVELFTHPTFDLLKPNLPLSDEARMAINILSRLLVSKTETSDVNVEQYAVLQQEKTLYFQYAEEMIATFSKAFELTIPENERILYTLNFIRNQVYYDVLSKNNPNTTMASFLIYTEKKHQEVKEAIEGFYQEFKSLKKTDYPFMEKQSEQGLLEDLIHIYDRYKKKEKIVIGVNFTRDYYINDDLCSQIEQHFGTKNVLLKKKAMNQCDIVISDCPLTHLPETTRIVYLIDGNITSKKMKELFKQLSDHIFDLRQE
ncbi:helix-turn-helix domain-containing protein [uncultured Enterococcus sp.]|uniref:helix-turn-helix domain-containing protein n=1 Tax=uncultured Enterococcus sp. TaxID=167972 RepID=UPI00258E15EA|nr:helix-turn-helix domain-containing protein [uncultured Enterococcus sp.]